ncbi:ABC transporter substrate-binding protein [Limobrevibacterium gyesilva]|uniref:ABC transporter substrate-binding protein n=1 Tax=Limobrevibacterium gyesilva TaxID=2991712 RepID=A0AA42CH71_9PROT|nr:ABC transporter substrate-binding protein [Limobrevibacterium gyesilva]MCW3474677.1 ABC transporter substrate-binding protein [Limobrevibacterium gyesilva]
MNDQTKGAFALSRRRLLAATAAGGLAAPWIWRRPAAAAGQVIIRTPGGAYDDIMRRHVYDPFTKATGVQVTPVAATSAKLLAMFKAKSVELDVIDTGDGQLLTLERMGALAPIAYDSWKWSDPNDVVAEVKQATRVGNFIYSTVLGYNKESFPDGKQPKGWAQFWDVQRFPGPRMLTDMAAGAPSLEFALLADGVPRDKLYPIDLDRALAMMTRIRPQIRKFWDTGALSAQMLFDKEVVLGSIWNGRLQTVIDKGAPLGMEWQENMIQVQALAIFKDSPNMENAQRLIDFQMQPQVQAGYSRDLMYGPTVKKAFNLLPKDALDRAPGGPQSRETGFYQNVIWWEDNRERVNRAWSRWLLG